ncbi:hypothetical protein JOM56_000105 [Amanita muscaria]
MSRHISDRFLDLEAEVDREEESPPEESEEELDDIIDDDDVDTNPLDYPPGIVRFNNLTEENADAERFFDILYNRATERGRSARRHEADSIPGLMEASMDPILYRVKCRHGCELDAVLCLLQLQLANPSKHNICAIFTHGKGTGYIYVEGLMDAQVQQLLRLVPGLLFSSGRLFLDSIPVGRLFFDQVPPTEVIATLTAPPYNPYQPEQWVKVLRGTYKGDIGFVSSVGSTGSATVLLIPRLQPPIEGLSGSKRKRPARPSPQLFNPQAIAFSFEEQPRPGDTDHIWRFNGLTFDHGLLRKTFKPGSAVPNVLVPSNVVITFCQSGYPIHPSLFEKPNRPLEWDFSPDDKVILVSRWRKGQNAIVVAVEERALEVEVSTGEVISVPWNDVQKDIKIGGFVKVLCGLHSGETGWVDKSFSVHANSVAMVNPSFSFLQPTALTDEQLEISAELRRKDPMPWIKRWVVVSKDGHALRGRYGQVVNVLPHQSTRSGLKIEVEMSYYNPNALFQRHIFDYDHLKDFQYNTELYTSPVPELYRPRHWVTPYPIGDLAQSRYGHTSNQLSTTPGYQSNTGGATPMYSPSAPVPSTPAWNPFAPTPMWQAMGGATPLSSAQSSSSPSSQHPVVPQTTPDTPWHPLLAIMDVRVEAVINGGQYNQKKAVVYASMVDGQPRIHHQNHGTVTILDPDWVSLPTVNVTCYDGLLVVIKGEHLEKRALVAFVNRVSGVQDTLTGEEQHLPADVLAMVSEEKTDKDRNNVVVQAR